jgi:hypothetical protein
MTKAPALSVINLQIAPPTATRRIRQRHRRLQRAAEDRSEQRQGDCRRRHDQPRKGRPQGGGRDADQGGRRPKPSREVFYNLGEVKFAKGKHRRGRALVRRPWRSDPSWGKPVFKLALVALNKGDKEGTIKMMEQVIAADPTSPEATQAKAVIEQLKK